jgi:lysophosphatidylcholine acyltransferase/lyso-PAF acetyltransferase
MYSHVNKFYEKIYVKKKTGKGEEDETIVNLHDEFDEFARRDTPVSFLQLFFGTFTLFFIKIISSFCFAINLSRKLYKKIKEKEDKKEPLTKEDITYITETTKFHASYFLYLSGIFFKKRRLPDGQILQVYKKYFGPDYKIEYEGKFGCYICNHTSFNDILLTMAIYGSGFISKEEVKNLPIFGPIAKGLNSVFVNRNNTESKEHTLKQIIERQKEIMEGKPVMPFMIFPEGTTSSGRHLLQFKRGAFYSLLPVKPNIILPNLNNEFHLGCGDTNVGINYGRTLTNLYVQTEFIELPIMTPNEYMYNNFSSFGKEKWEIYKEVAREIMCILGDFQKSDSEFIDSKRYDYCIKNRVFVEKEKFQI